MLDFLKKDIKKSILSDPINAFNSLIGYLGIKIKTLGEDYGIFKGD